MGELGAAGAVALGTPFTTWRRGSLINATVAAFVRPVIQTATPVSDEANGRIVINTPGTQRLGRNLTTFQFFGENGDNEMIDVRLWRWRKHLKVGAGNVDLWIPEIAAEFEDLTLEILQLGLAGEDITELEFFADTFVTYKGPTPNEPVDWAGVGAISLVLDALGAAKWEVQFQAGSTPAAKGNFLYGSD